jgi:hypothetical protein
MSGRVVELDIVRGLLLVNIMFNHTPGPHNQYTSQPLGFVSSAEGFFFLSGYLLGSISARLQHQERPLFARLWARVRLIYIAHVLALALVFLLIGQAFGHLVPFSNIVHPYLQDPTSAVLGALLLVYQPPLLDILPLYIIFMAITPLLWWLARSCHWLTVFALSTALWWWAQFNGMNSLLSFVAPWLLVKWGAFHLLSWQFLWVVGLGLGVWHWRRRAAGLSLRLPWWLSLSAVLIMAFFYAWRMPWIPFSVDLGPLWLLLDKWRLGPLRLLNFAAMIIVFISFAGLFRVLLRPLSFLAVLGRHSLLVFSVHAVLGLLLAAWINLVNPAHSVRMILLGGQIALIFIWARRLDLNRQAAKLC